MALRTRLRAAVRALLHDPDATAPQAFPAGAFYSPIVSAREVLSAPDRDRLWPRDVRDPLGIDIRADAQLALLRELTAHPLPAEWVGPGPFDADNDQFPVQDAALLYALVRHRQPQRVVEVGCGWSTAVMARAIADGGLATSLTCIEPYPRDFLRSIAGIELRQEKVEHTPPEVFGLLGPGDVLFIDSSHVVKTGSDVVHLFLEVVPRLSPGVIVHVHDMFIPEDYPQGWVRAGFGWNEQYVVQAFLAGNARVQVLAMNHWLALRHPEEVQQALGPVATNGSSMWFELRDAADG